LAETAKADAGGFANATCPMRGAPIDPKNVPAGRVRHFRGRKVAFCCDGCPKAWGKLSDEQKQSRLEKAAPAPPRPATSETSGIVNHRCPIMGSPLDRGKVREGLTRRFRGRKVGFCCAGCPKAWDKLSEQEKESRLRGARTTK
jgi:hypothetical protein